MSAVEMETNVRPCGCAGRGRHKNSCPESGMSPLADAPPLEEPNEIVPDVPMWYGLAIMPDEEMEQYGGDLSALESHSARSRRPVPTARTPRRAASLTAPDLTFKGLLVSRHSPSKLFHFIYAEDDGTRNSRQGLYTIRQRGYRPVTVADFFVHSTLRDVLIPEDGTATGRLTLGGASKGGVTVVYAQDETNYWKARKEEREISDSIQATTAQRAAQIQEDLNRNGLGGITTTSEWEE